MEQIIITKPDGSTYPLASKRTATEIKSAKQSWALLADDVVSINIESPFPQTYGIGDHFTVFGRAYKLNRLPKVKKTGMHAFSYDLEFEGIQYDLIRATYDLTIDTTNNQLQDVQADTLTGNLRRFATVLISNANRVFPNTWVLGSCPETIEDKTLTFGEGDNCLSVLQTLCTEFGVEFEIVQSNGKFTINFVSKVGQIFPFTFEFGKGKGLYSLDRQNVDSSNIITRLKVYGSTSNITNKYRASRLCLPGKTKAQSYIEKPEAVAKYGIYESTKYFDDIKPTFNGSITGLVSGSVLKFIDTKMFDLNALEADGKTTKYLIEGCAAKVHFNTGNLAGYEFEVHAYDHTTKTFTLVKQTDDRGDVFPSESSSAFQFAQGNEYKLLDIALPDIPYQNDAENKLNEQGNIYYDQNSQPKVQYGLSVTKAYLKTLVGNGTTVNIFAPGDYIPVKDSDIDVDKSVRIKSLTRNLLDEYEYTLTISDTVSTNITNRVISELVDIDKIITINNLKDPVRARANWRSSREVLNMVFDPEGDYYTDKIKPNSIDTLALSVGAKSMQLMLQNTLIEANYQGNKNIVKVTGGVLTHYAIEENIRDWNLTNATTTLSSDSDAFYIYAKCQKSGVGGTIIFSKAQIRVDADVSFYHFWLGVLHTAVDEVRAISLTYGATTINGKFIRTGQIESTDGSCFINLDGNGLRLGDNISSLAWNNNNDRKLRLKGSLVVSASGDESALGVYRGSYSGYTLYYSGDEVSYNGSIYRCKLNCPTAGIMPINTLYWNKTVEKGSDGQPGAKGEVGEMISGGKMLYRDPEFREGINACAVYNNSANGTVTITRIEKPADCPTTSTHCLEIKTTGSASPGNGGFYLPIQSRANAVFIQKIVAKLPVGYYLVNHANSQGDGASDTFITPVTGTGKYETYLRKVVCGVSGIFHSGGYIVLDGGTAPVTWHVASATIYDITDTEKYDQAIMTSQQAAENYAKAKAELAEVTAKAYADGVVDAEEARAIADATNKSNYAREAAITAAQEADKAIIIGSGKNYIPNSRFDTMDALHAADCLGSQTTRDIILTPIGWVLALKSLYTRFTLGDAYDFAQGDEIVISALIKSEVNTSLDFSVSHIDGGGASGWGEERASVTTEWKVVYVTFKIATNEPNNSPAVWIHPSQCHFYIAWIKLEKGNKPNGYIPFEEVKKISQRNYLQGCKFNTPEKVNLFEGAKEIVDDSVYGKVLKLSGKLSYLNYISGNNWKRDGLAQSQIMTVSMTVRSNKFSKLRLVISLGDGSYQWLPFVENVGWFYCTPAWRVVHISFNIQTDAPDAGQMFILYPGYSGESEEFYIANITLTKGNKPSLYDDTLDIQNDTIAKSISDSAKNLGFTSIDGGLIQSNLIKLQRIGGQETAGISGIDKNSQGQTLPALWAGGTYSQALNRQANVDIYHNGKSKLGRLFVNEDGSTVYKDTSNVDRIYITPEKISALADLTGSSQPETGVNTNSYGKTIFLEQHNEDVLLGSIYVSKNSSDLIIKNLVISTSIQNDVELGNASAEVKLYVKSGGSVIAQIDIVGVSYYGKDESPLSPSASKTIDTSFKVPMGNYQLYAEVSLSSTSGMIAANCYISAGRFTWQYIANISKSELGQNGLLSFRDINNYIYSAIENNLLNFVVKTKGKWDTPGVLAAYSVSAGGTIINRWGGMINANANAYRASTGMYDVPHQIGHTDYMASVTVNSNETFIGMIVTKNSNSVRIAIKGLDDGLWNFGFDIMIVGRNTV